MLKLVSLSRLPYQLTACANVALYLLDGDCIGGAVRMADAVCSSLVASASDFQLDEQLTKVFVKMVVVMEADSSTCSEQRSDQLVVLFSRLPSHLQCSAIIEADQTVEELHKSPGLPKSKAICKRLCGLFPSTVKLSWPLDEAIVKDFDRVVATYLKLEEMELLQLLVEKICSFDSPEGRNLLIQKTLSSKDVLNLLASFELGRHLIHQLTISWISALSSVNTNLKNFRRSLFSCLLQVVQMDQLDSSFSANPRGIETLKKLLEKKLHMETFCRFINDLRVFLPPLLPKSIRDIIDILLGRLRKASLPKPQVYFQSKLHALIESDYKLVFETLFIFARTDQLEPAVEVFCKSVQFVKPPPSKSSGQPVQRPSSSRKFSNRCSMLKDIITVESIWSSLSKTSRNLVRNNCYGLIKTIFLVEDEDIRNLRIGNYGVCNREYLSCIVSCIELVLTFEQRKPMSVDWTGAQKAIHSKLLQTVNIFFTNCNEQRGRGRQSTFDCFEVSNIYSVFQYLSWLANHHQELQTLPVMSTLVQKIIDVSAVPQTASTKDNPMLSAVVLSEEIRQLISTTSNDYFLVFNRLVDERILQLTSVSNNSSQSNNQQNIEELKTFLQSLKFTAGPPVKRVKMDPLL